MKKTNLTIRGIFLLIGLLAGTLLLSQSIDFQTTLSAGDHGLVLYAAEAALRGEAPYHDYHYFYGPLMPYYYSVFLKFFGNSIISVLIGEKLLILVSGLLVYAGLSLFLSPFFSLTGALWFWVFNNNFFYTYNHVGITAVSLAVIYGVLRYYHYKNTGSLYAALAGCFVAGLIKLNFGGALLAAVILSALLIDVAQKQRLNKRFYLTAVVLAPAAILLSNAAFLIGLPMHIIRQCYQYFGNDCRLKILAQHF